MRLRTYLYQTLAIVAFCPVLLQVAQAQVKPGGSSYKGKKILHIDSYQLPYEWSADIRTGVASVLNGTGIELRTESMDSKVHGDEESKRKAALRIKAAIEEFKPDVIIATDDNASKYVIEPFYKNSPIPVVFSGVNWDSSKYGYPYKNATGMEEVDMVVLMLKLLRNYTKGIRVGIIAGDDETSRTDAKIYNQRFLGNEATEVYSHNFKEFQQQFIELQKRADIIIVGSNGSIKGWEAEAAEKFFLKNTRVPTSAKDTFMSQFVLVTYAKYGEEQGEWAAQTALRILTGTAPSTIPITQNKRMKLILNQDIAKKLGIVFPAPLLKIATIFEHGKSMKLPEQRDSEH